MSTWSNDRKKNYKAVFAAVFFNLSLHPVQMKLTKPKQMQITGDIQVKSAVTVIWLLFPVINRESTLWDVIAKPFTCTMENHGILLRYMILLYYNTNKDFFQ